MRGNCEIGTAAREAKCVRLVRFEHTVGFLKFTSGCLVKVGYVAEQAHLQGRVKARKEKSQGLLRTKGSYIFFSSAAP